MTSAELPPGVTAFAEDGATLDLRSLDYRFPIVSTAYPRWCYITAVVAGGHWDGAAPTDDELRMVASFHDEYVSRYYNPSYIERMRARPFDVDCGANGRYLIKYEHGGWAFRRSSWDSPTFFPGPHDPPMTLLQVLDHEQRFSESRPNPTWEKWKAEHPGVFSAVEGP